MEKEFSVLELYREIGRTFHGAGADKVVLLRARNQNGMSLEIAVDGFFDKRKLQDECEKKWPEVAIRLLDLNEDENLELVDEVMEDGILL